MEPLTMSGGYSGLQSRIQSHNEKALYVHCHAHCLNLVLVESAKIKSALFESLHTFLARSPKRHAAFVKLQQTMYPGQRVCELKRLSDTRWAGREDALRSLKKVPFCSGKASSEHG
ncbi:hypothetical protein N1851_023102 [Merluccius polli]|uniref:Uncharacterized protein n=1 Tax=Merluccius polli TaxID=89951 RepID=A0AA47MH32_MERPO|nr:hypothetical protein N1851_023102 [Merluccius polli]